MVNNHRPHGRTPASWEADLLKLRAFEMVLVLFYMEDLKKFILTAIEFTDKLNGVNRLDDGEPKTKEPKESKKIKLARAVLVSEGVINQAESNELKNLLDYRNTIGHEIHNLTVDVGAYSGLTRRDPKTFKPIPAYDYSSAKRAKQLRQRIMTGMTGKFVISVSMASLSFEAAEKTYTAEIKRLKARVNKGIDRANAVISETNRIIDFIPKSVIESVQLDHPWAINENGKLNKLGASCAFRLFDAHATPLAVSYVMRISLRSANLWFKKWQTARIV